MEENLRFKIDWPSLTVGSKFNAFCFVLLCIPGQFSMYKPPGGLYLDRLIHGGAYFLNFMVLYLHWQFIGLKSTGDL